MNYQTDGYIGFPATSPSRYSHGLGQTIAPPPTRESVLTNELSRASSRLSECESALEELRHALEPATIPSAPMPADPNQTKKLDDPCSDAIRQLRSITHRLGVLFDCVQDITARVQV